MLVGYELLNDRDNHALMRSLQKAGCQKIFTDPQKGATGIKTGLKQMLEFVNPGDVVVVKRLDRLGKTVWLIVKIIDRLIAKGVMIKSIEENLLISTSSTAIELLEVLKKFEEKAIESRSLKREATLQKNGNKNGRPPIKEEVREIARNLAKEMTVQDVCKHLGISRAAYYSYFPSSKKK